MIGALVVTYSTIARHRSHLISERDNRPALRKPDGGKV